MSQPIPEFGKFLESLRGSMSLREAAKRSGLSHAYIRDLELERNRSTNEKITPSPDTLKKLSIAYSYPYTELMIKAGHLMSEDVQPSLPRVSSTEKVDLSEVLFIEIGRNQIIYNRVSGAVAESVDSLIDFSSFMDKLDENDFKKVDTDLYVNFKRILKYVESEGKVYFDEPGLGPSVTMSAIRQKKYHDLIMRTVMNNTNGSLEFSFGQAGVAGKFGTNVQS